MKAIYEKPEIEIHNYSLPSKSVILMGSDPTDNGDHDLNNGTDYGEDIFGGGA